MSRWRRLQHGTKSTFLSRSATERWCPERAQGDGGDMPATPTTAMVLSAGLGTRMAPANGGVVPKPLVRLGGKALIDHVLDRHVEAGIVRAVVNVHHKADLIESHLEGRRAPRIEISDERNKL